MSRMNMVEYAIRNFGLESDKTLTFLDLASDDDINDITLQSILQVMTTTEYME